MSGLLERSMAFVLVCLFIVTIPLLIDKYLRPNLSMRRIIWAYFVWDALLFVVLFSPMVFDERTGGIFNRLPAIFVYVPISLLLPLTQALVLLWSLREIDTVIYIGIGYIFTFVVAVFGVWRVIARA